MAENKRVAGVDGCRRGWVAVIAAADRREARLRFVKSLGEMLDVPDAPEVVALDMPIGLPERSGSGGRSPERLVRPFLAARQSSVFSIPSRAAVYAASDESIPEPDRFRHACAIARATSTDGKAVSKQAFQIFGKIIEIDGLLRERADLAGRVYECHPELSFWAMNGRAPIDEPKKVKGVPYGPGLELRRRLLLAHGFESNILEASVARECKAGLDDVIDACAATWTAARIVRGEAISFPDPPERDAFGLPIAIWV
jgi:predicted RNase H-like nuclease